MSSEDLKLWDFFKAQACQEQTLQKQNQSLTEQLNLQNQNLHRLGSQTQRAQITINSLNQRLQDLDLAYQESERMRNFLELQLGEERQKHQCSQEALQHEFACHVKTETALERQSQTMTRMSEFLTLVQMAPSEDKELMVKTLMNENEIESMMTDLEEKNRMITNLEEQQRNDRTDFEETISNLQKEHLDFLQQHFPEESIIETTAVEQMTPLEKPQSARQGRSRRRQKKDNFVE